MRDPENITGEDDGGKKAALALRAAAAQRLDYRHRPRRAETDQHAGFKNTSAHLPPQQIIDENNIQMS